MARATPARIARLAVLLLPTVLVVAAVAVTTSIAFAVQERSIRESTGERVSEVATSLASLAQVRQVLSAVDGDADIPAATAELQPLASLIEQAAGVDYVVIADERGIRVTHPTPEKRGGRVSTDHSEAIAGRAYLGTETGTLGPTLRAKVPVFGPEDRAVIGALSVGILESRISAEHAESSGRILPWAIGALVLGTLASSAIAAAVGRRFRRLEEREREGAELRRTAAALQEQAHEFSTRLHVVHGLVSHGDAAAALDYIGGLTEVTAEEPGEVWHEQPLLRATLDALRAELGAHGARLEAAVAGTAPVDEEVLLVLANLCRNAGEAGAGLVRCTLEERDGRIFGTVEDDGPGIPAADAARLFARGGTTKPAAAGAVGGRGIGLDLVRRTVAGRGGAVELDRSTLGGARFRFDLEVRA